jgi:hypothetical protein
MKQEHCNFEEKIAEACRSGHWDDALLAHIASCRVCEEVALVASYLSESAAAPHVGANLPDATLIWSKAQLAARRDTIERAMRPILWTRRFAFGSCAVVIVTAIVMAWSRIGEFFRGFAESWLAHRAAAPAGHGNPLLLLTAAFLLILLPLAFGLYAVWSED